MTERREITQKELDKMIENCGTELILENIKITKVSHEEFKKLTKESKAVVRTGECSPYANIILKSGVVF